MSAISPEDRALRCSAYDCPNNWSVSREGYRPLCQYHAWEPQHEWPRITEQLLREIAFKSGKVTTPAKHLSPAEKMEILNRLRTVLSASSRENMDHKAWAKRLQARHEAGQTLSQNQIRCYRAALRMTDAHDEGAAF